MPADVVSNRTKVLIIAGSERASGNTSYAVDYAAITIKARQGYVETIHLRDYNITPCGACGNCNYRSDSCSIDDDISMIIEKMTISDCIIYAVPVHGFGMAHLMQIFVERAGVCFLRFDRPLANKIGGVIVIGRRYSHMDVYSQLINNVLLNRMILVGSGYPAVVFGGGFGDAAKDSEGKDAIEQMIDRMMKFSAILKDADIGAKGVALELLTRNERDKISQ